MAAALAFAADLAWTWRALDRKLTRLQAVASAMPVSVARTPMREPADGELAFARDTLRRLSTPWDRLFGALQAAQGERVALLAIEPDAEAGTVAISAEARDYYAALTYVANLAEQKSLTRVHLARHELARAGARFPVAFTVSAAWREAR